MNRAEKEELVEEIFVLGLIIGFAVGEYLCLIDQLDKE